MKELCKKVITEYLDFLKKYFECFEEEKNVLRIVTPFLDLSSDCFEFFIKKINDDYFLITDFGETLRILDSQNLSFSSNTKRFEIIKDLSNYYEINFEDNEFKTFSTLKELGYKISNFINLITKINSLLFTTRISPPIPFKQEVKFFLEEKNIKDYKENSEYMGISNLKYQIDFTFLNGRERNLITISPSSKTESLNLSTSAIAKIEDIKERIKSFYCSVLYNDSIKEYWDYDIISYLKYYNANPISWIKEKDKLERYAKVS